MNDTMPRWAKSYITEDLIATLRRAEHRWEHSPIGTYSMSTCGHAARGYDPACIECMREEVKRRTGKESNHA